MKIKTYPLQFAEDYLKKIEEKARSKGMNIKEFIMNAIEKEMKK